MKNLYLVVVLYIDGMDIIGIYDDYMLAEKTIDDLKRYKKCFGTEERFIIYDFSNHINNYVDYLDIHNLEVISIKGNN